MNITEGDESVLLQFETDDGPQAHVLIEAGAGVDIDDHLGDDERKGNQTVTVRTQFLHVLNESQSEVGDLVELRISRPRTEGTAESD